MRWTIGDTIVRPARLAGWWIDLPMRERMWWQELLWAPGAGWLRWKPDWRERVYYDPPDIEQWVVYPPLHRAWLAVSMFVRHPWSVWRGECEWNEWPSLIDVSVLKDDERKRLWA